MIHGRTLPFTQDSSNPSVLFSSHTGFRLGHSRTNKSKAPAITLDVVTDRRKEACGGAKMLVHAWIVGLSSKFGTRTIDYREASTMDPGSQP